MNSTERINRFIRNEPVDRPPVTPIFMMFAAKYIDKTYRDYYLDYRVLVESYLRCHERFQFDMMMVISDPYRETEGIGGSFEYPEDSVPRCTDYAIKQPADLKKLKVPDPWSASRMQDRLKACELYKKEIGEEIPILGWIEGPMAQMVDLHGMDDMMVDMIVNPEFTTEFAEYVVKAEKLFALEQIKAGANWIGIGDAAASLISPQQYRDFIMPKQKELVDFIHQNGARAKIHICGNITNHLDSLFQTGADIIDLDWMVPIEKAVELIKPNMAICGNFDPVSVLLYGTPEQVFDAASDCMQKGKGRLIISAGCEVPPDTPPENVDAFCSPAAFDKYRVLYEKL